VGDKEHGDSGFSERVTVPQNPDGESGEEAVLSRGMRWVQHWGCRAQAGPGPKCGSRWRGDPGAPAAPDTGRIWNGGGFGVCLPNHVSAGLFLLPVPTSWQGRCAWPALPMALSVLQFLVVLQHLSVLLCT